jgi:hypothetical protein
MQMPEAQKEYEGELPSEQAAGENVNTDFVLRSPASS